MNEITYIGYVLGSEFGADDHYVYRATITLSLLDRIAQLAREIKRLDVFCIQLFEPGVQVFSRWPVGMPEATFHGDGEPEEPDEDDPFHPERDEVYADCLKLTVYGDGDFRWSWYPKHGGRNDDCDTDNFNLQSVHRDIQ